MKDWFFYISTVALCWGLAYFAGCCILSLFNYFN
jgi:hypothetical protein